jgi:hypothetical protein
MEKNLNSNLKKAKSSKRDEFYTQLTDIEKELKHYKNHFNGKVILCNCDDPRTSNFFKYFSLNFEVLGLKKLITTCYKNQNPDLFSNQESEKAIYLEYNGDKNNNNLPDDNETTIYPLNSDGDFRSKECIELLKQADIVITNPPFSLFREYLAQLIEFDKKFIIMGHQNAITYKEVFKLFRGNKIWLGVDNGGTKWFKVNEDYDISTDGRKKIENGEKFFSLGNVVWITNLDNPKRQEKIILYKEYNEIEFPKYDNYNAIEVSKVANIPFDFDGVMGVPITFLDKYNPDQFDILGLSSSASYNSEIVGIPFLGYKDARPLIKGKNTYARILIKKK